ncbi:hypothetical protein NKH77_49310 [Streptomyces sp. M19]
MLRPGERAGSLPRRGRRPSRPRRGLRHPDRDPAHRRRRQRGRGGPVGTPLLRRRTRAVQRLPDRRGRLLGPAPRRPLARHHRAVAHLGRPDLGPPLPAPGGLAERPERVLPPELRDEVPTELALPRRVDGEPLLP